MQPWSSLWQENEVPEIGGMGAVEPIGFEDVKAELEDEVEVPGMQSKDSLSKKLFPIWLSLFETPMP